MNTWEQEYHNEAGPLIIVATSTSIQGSDSSSFNSSSLNSSSFNSSSNQPFSLIDSALFTMIGVAALLVTGLTIGKLSWAYRQKNRQQSFGLQSADTMPCRGCQYFSANPYLRCTVHPITVMTEASSNCSDYSANDDSANDGVKIS